MSCAVQNISIRWTSLRMYFAARKREKNTRVCWRRLRVNWIEKWTWKGLSSGKGCTRSLSWHFYPVIRRGLLPSWVVWWFMRTTIVHHQTRMTVKVPITMSSTIKWLASYSTARKMWTDGCANSTTFIRGRKGGISPSSWEWLRE